MILHNAWQHTGFISGYDPNNPVQAFQLDFADPRDSFWEASMAFKHLRVWELCCGSKSFSREIRNQFPGAEWQHVILAGDPQTVPWS